MKRKNGLPLASLTTFFISPWYVAVTEPSHYVKVAIQERDQLPVCLLMMSMVFNVPPTAKVIRGRAILAKGIAERIK